MEAVRVLLAPEWPPTGSTSRVRQCEADVRGPLLQGVCGSWGHLGVKWGLPADADMFHHNPKTLLAKKPSEQPQHR
jgi:hypothetical protein